MLHEPNTGASSGGLSRRAFLVTTAAAGGGLVIGVGPSFAAGTNPGTQSSGAEFTGQVAIMPDGKVVVRATKMEIGNGVLTGIAMAAAEELGCDWSTVSAEYMLPNRNLLENNVYSRTGILA